MEIYNAICKLDSQWEFAVWLRELEQRLCATMVRFILIPDASQNVTSPATSTTTTIALSQAE